MAGIQISALPAVPSAALTDVFPIDQSAVTYKADLGQVLTLFRANGAALTKADDTNVTLTLGGSPSTALFNATSITAGWTGLLSPARGGTGVNNATNTLTLAGNLATAGAFASTFTMTAATNVTFPTSGTLATTASIPTGAALTKADDTNVTLTLGGSASTALVNAASITAGWTGVLSGTRGGTGVNNGASTITIAGSLTFAGAFTFGATLTANTALTFPTTGTLATLAGTETLTGKTFNLANNTLTGTFAQFNTACSDDDFMGLATAQQYTATKNFAMTTLTSTANSIAWNLAANQVAKHTATENTTLAAPTNQVAGATYIFIFVQDTTPRTLGFNSVYKFPGGADPVVSTGSGAVDVISFISDGTNMYGTFAQNFS